MVAEDLMRLYLCMVVCACACACVCAGIMAAENLMGLVPPGT